MRRRGAGRDGEKERGWREAVKRWAKSGLSVREFCRRNALSEPSFYGWRRTLAQRDAVRAARGKPPIASRRSGKLAPGGAAKRSRGGNRVGQAAAPAFLPVALSASPFAPPACEIVSPDGWQVRLMESPTSETLLHVLRLLGDQASVGREEGR